MQPPPRVHAITRPRNTAAARPYYQDCFNVFHTLTRAALHTCTKQERNRLPQRCRFGFFFSLQFFSAGTRFSFYSTKNPSPDAKNKKFYHFHGLFAVFHCFLGIFSPHRHHRRSAAFYFSIFWQDSDGVAPFIWKNLDLDFLFWNRHIDGQKSADSSFHWQLF